MVDPYPGMVCRREPITPSRRRGYRLFLPAGIAGSPEGQGWRGRLISIKVAEAAKRQLVKGAVMAGRRRPGAAESWGSVS